MRIQERNERWDQEIFLNKLRSTGASRYHDKHPFHQYMNSGQLSREQVKGWVANQFYYQKHIPLKDAAIISNCPIREVRRLWLCRISDSDGVTEGEGGIEAWLTLAEAAGLSHREILGEEHVLPGVRFAVDSYLGFARNRPWPLAVASSLTDLFAPDLMQERLRAIEQFYTWVAPSGLEYFRSRLIESRRNSDEGLSLTLHYCETRDMQEAALRALAFKCDILWSLLDALMLAYGTHLEYAGIPSLSVGNSR